MKKLASVVVMLVAGTSQAAGFAVTTHNARATGMASAMTGHVQDASSIAFNPAGLAGLEKFEVQLGLGAISPMVQFTGRDANTTEDSEFAVAPPPHLYVAFPLAKGLTAGVGVFAPFGAALEWPDDFSGKFLSTYSELATFNINPSVAYAPMEWLRVGAGVQLLYGMVDIRNRIVLLPTDAEGGIKLTGSGTGVGFDVGVQADIIQGLFSAGATYRSAATVGMEGDGEFEDVPAELQQVYSKQDISLDVPTPDSLALGLALRPSERLLIAFDAIWWNWSRHDQIEVEFENPLFNSTLVRAWRDRWTFDLGAEYAATQALTLRAGVGYDPTPAPSGTLRPDLPDADRIKGTLGLGYSFGKFSVAGAYELLQTLEKESTVPELPGDYKGAIHVLTFTLGYRGS